MNCYRTILVAAAVAALVGCATTPTPQAADSPDDKAYVTGSRLPVRDGNTSANVKGITDRQSIDAMTRPGGYISPKDGGM